MKYRLGVELTKTQIKNKWDKLKEYFKAWKKSRCFGSITNTGMDHWSPLKVNASTNVDQRGTQEEALYFETQEDYIQER
jgi:hypothetical protein